ncbi:MAG TPA: 7-carboxy-7-deazaguanine synthase QueE [Gammaproteobacteria bacterium]|nr:7-carboxy-7-deazaguanine synthase QueE [Gammaproteobacteria bacterium]
MSEAITCRVTEIFYSLQGETRTVGLPTVFIRLTGCPLRCHYCDTAYAFHGGEKLSIEDIMTKVADYSPQFVTVTGGEPLAQKSCIPLVKTLCDAGYSVSVETSGALSIAALDRRATRVVDIKTPGSGEEKKNDYDNIALLSEQDQVKFVICHRQDYEWTKKVLAQYDMASRCEVLLSPEHEQLAPEQLADWMLVDKITARFQLQLHKYLWQDAAGK